jgi:phosphate transport system ATP-binding protein
VNDQAYPVDAPPSAPMSGRPGGTAKLPLEKPSSAALRPRAEVQHLSFYYGAHQALKDISIPVADCQVTALIGPSGCGKSTFLRCFNRMHDLQQDTRYEGAIMLHPENANLVGRDVDPIEVRMRIGMVFQKPNPFPTSIFEMWPTVCGCGGFAAGRFWRKKWNRRCAAQHCGRK